MTKQPSTPAPRRWSYRFGKRRRRREEGGNGVDHSRKISTMDAALLLKIEVNEQNRKNAKATRENYSQKDQKFLKNTASPLPAYSERWGRLWRRWWPGWCSCILHGLLEVRPGCGGLVSYRPSGPLDGRLSGSIGPYFLLPFIEKC